MVERKVPGVIRNNRFLDGGLVETKEGLLVPAYVASQFGFNEPGKDFLYENLYPRLRRMGVLALCPFEACAEFIDFDRLKDDSRTVAQDREFWDEFTDVVGEVNYRQLMPHSKLMLALFDGGHTSDDGVCAEVGHYAAMKYGPVVGIRSDIRLAENPAATVNPALRYHMDRGPFNGHFFEGSRAYVEAYERISGLALRMRK